MNVTHEYVYVYRTQVYVHIYIHTYILWPSKPLLLGLNVEHGKTTTLMNLQCSKQKSQKENLNIELLQLLSFKGCSRLQNSLQAGEPSVCRNGNFLA